VYQLTNVTPKTPHPWAFVAFVIAANPVRKWKTWQGAGSLQELYVADTRHGCTRATLFGEAIDLFSAIATPGTTCYFEGGRIKQSFGSKKEIELSFGSGSNIRPATTLSVAPSLSVVGVKEWASLPVDSVATAIGVVHRVGALKRIVTKKGKSTEKRDLLLVDNSDMSLVCTTWGQLARDDGSIGEGAVVVIKNATLSDYNNLRTASIGVGSSLLYDPAIAQAEVLRNWYEGLPANHSFTPLNLE
ncbi:DAN Replication protein, partial [Phytophthora megakarya]